MSVVPANKCKGVSFPVLEQKYKINYIDGPHKIIYLVVKVTSQLLSNKNKAENESSCLIARCNKVSP